MEIVDFGDHRPSPSASLATPMILWQLHTVLVLDNDY